MTANKRYSILVVEDVEEVRVYLQILFSKAFPEALVQVASSTPEAELEILKNRPNLILCDEFLGLGSSIDFVERFRKEGLMILLMTSLDSLVIESKDSRIKKPSHERDESSFLRLIESKLRLETI
jgi:CheY-like chemotaxis protein